MGFLWFFFTMTLVFVMPIYSIINTISFGVLHGVEIPLAISMSISGILTRIAFDRRFRSGNL